ncbi:MAG: hypothetical protein N2114_05985 [Candidatus Goldbacteria bacterium]|nr:hypothetical protein [Candidatus Goldiibacteriota bacterium]
MTDVIEEKPKAKRGRPPKETVELSEESLRFLLAGIFNILSERLGEHWQLSSDELNYLAQSYYKFLKAQSKVIADNLITINFVITNLIVILPRIIKTIKKDKSEQ